MGHPTGVRPPGDVGRGDRVASWRTAGLSLTDIDGDVSPWPDIARIIVASTDADHEQKIRSNKNA
jgi:hypothetical protein